MKKNQFFATPLLLTIALFCATQLSAQWSQNATSIWNTTLTKKVGIGTSSPTSNFHVNVPSSSTPISAMSLDVQSFGNSPNATASHYFRVRDIGAGTTPFYIRGDGKVGIGTTSPNAALDVRGTASVSKTLNVGDNSNTGVADIGFAGAYGEGIGSKRTAGGNQYGLDIFTGFQRRLSITNGGNIGIGITSPTAKLQIANGNLHVDSGYGIEFGDQLNLSPSHSKIWEDVGSSKLFIRPGGANYDYELGSDGNETVEVMGRMSINAIAENAPALKFNGSTSGEGINSKRSSGGNQWGLDFYTSHYNRMSITNSGNVGIGTSTPVAKLEVYGSNATGVRGTSTSSGGTGGIFEANSSSTAYGVWGKSTSGYAGYFSGKVHITGGLTWNSDARLKENIHPITNALEAIQKIETSTYTFKTKDYPTMNLPDGKQYGFIAQNIEGIFPEMVSNVADKSTEPVKEFKAVNYVAMIPVLTQGIREQQEQIEHLQAIVNEKERELAHAYELIEALSARLSKLESALGVTNDRQSTDAKSAIVSAKISPNPTAGLVTVKLENTTAAKTVVVKIMNAVGREVTSHTSVNGENNIQFDLTQFPAGVYVAQIIADGKMISSSKVQLVK